MPRAWNKEKGYKIEHPFFCKALDYVYYDNKSKEIVFRLYGNDLSSFSLPASEIEHLND